MNRQITIGYADSLGKEIICPFLVLQAKKGLLTELAKHFVYKDNYREFCTLWNDGYIQSEYFIDGAGSDLMIYRFKLKQLVPYDATTYLLNSEKWQIVTDKFNNPVKMLSVREV